MARTLLFSPVLCISITGIDYCGQGGSEHVHKCGNCGGSGLAMSFGAGGSTMITSCDQCGGLGIIGRCNVCGGSGLIQMPKQYTFQLPAKTAVGSSVRYYGDGNESPHADIPGDFVLEFDVRATMLEMFASIACASVAVCRWIGTTFTVAKATICSCLPTQMRIPW